ncbi:MAG TPA: hypothetical protein VHX20_19230 [Terracidiphilus sp.]|jgi:hypothetical protein|nr:hypothetical protein [Terracidiphilus sp.]
MLKSLLALVILMNTLMNATAGQAAAQANVRIESSVSLKGSRVLEPQTASVVIHDYLQSWHSLSAALEQNRANLLDTDFVGTARDKMGDTVREQATLGLTTHYHDRSHDIQIVFYSPEGLSIELTDTVEYEVQVEDHGAVIGSQQMHARYVVVLTPTEARWKVRVFQTQS